MNLAGHKTRLAGAANLNNVTSLLSLVLLVFTSLCNDLHLSLVAAVDLCSQHYADVSIHLVLPRRGSLFFRKKLTDVYLFVCFALFVLSFVRSFVRAIPQIAVSFGCRRIGHFAGVFGSPLAPG